MASSSSPSSLKRQLPDSASNQENHKKKNHWSVGLSSALQDESVQLYKDDLCTVIKDKYPKARTHLLVLPNEPIHDLKALNGTHVPLLKHMLKVGKEVAEKTAAKMNAQGLSNQFRFGFHAIPSMALLHMHIISQDFISDSLKTKKHWNSFTSDYFLEASEVIDGLQANDHVRVDNERIKKMLDRPLQCHQCSTNPKNMPSLKQHLLKHSS